MASNQVMKPNKEIYKVQSDTSDLAL